MITLATLTLSDRSGLMLDSFVLEAALTGAGHVALTFEQGSGADSFAEDIVSLMPVLSLGDLRRLRDFLATVSVTAELCLDAARGAKPDHPT